MLQLKFNVDACVKNFSSEILFMYRIVIMIIYFCSKDGGKVDTRRKKITEDEWLTQITVHQAYDELWFN